MRIEMTINGALCFADVPPMKPLLSVLREDLDLRIEGRMRRGRVRSMFGHDRRQAGQCMSCSCSSGFRV